MIKWIFALFVSLTFTPVFAQNDYDESIPKTPLSTSISILDSRLYFNFPLGTTDAGNNPIPSKQSLTLKYSIDQLNLLFVCNELNAFTTDNLLDVLDKSYNPNGAKKFKLEEIDFHKELKTIQYIPNSLTQTNNRVLIKGLIVELQDHSLIRIDAYVNSEGLYYSSAFEKLIDKIFSSITPGKRLLNLTERQEQITLFDKKSSLQLNVPEGFILVESSTPQYSIYTIKEVKPADVQVKEQMILYVGPKPFLLHKNLGYAESDKKPLKGKLIGQTIEWHEYKKKDIPTYLIEQMIPLNMGTDETKLHVAVFGEQMEVINLLKGSIENAELILLEEEKK